MGNVQFSPLGAGAQQWLKGNTSPIYNGAPSPGYIMGGASPNYSPASPSYSPVITIIN